MQSADQSSEGARREWAVPGVPDHHQRESLSNELHARPPFSLRAPAVVSHLALLSGDQAAARERLHVSALCRRFGASEPTGHDTYWKADLGVCQINWERHTEFSTYTFYREGFFAEPFGEPALTRVPRDWLADLAGEVVVAVHVAVEASGVVERDGAELAALFTSQNIVGSQVFDGGARVWSDFRLHTDGFRRLLVRVKALGPNRTGRLVQRLLEIETYQMLALLSLPLARRYTAQINDGDRALAELTGRLATASELSAERDLLSELSRAAGEIERIAAATNYRFGATKAYYTLVQRRIAELREQRMDGRQTIREFMDRRLAPAMSTCDSVRDRLAALSQRISRASDLLRTRVDVALESQNQELLRSMDQRARLQLRLQETVEGLSVVVLSYYAVGLLAYLFKAAKSVGLLANVELAVGLSVPAVLAGVWLAIRRVRNRLR